MRLQVRLVIGFLLAHVYNGHRGILVGIVMIHKTTLDEVQRKVQQDINTAKLVFRYNLESLENQLQFIALRSPIHEAVTRGISIPWRNCGC
jgi:hypothetical protein